MPEKKKRLFEISIQLRDEKDSQTFVVFARTKHAATRQALKYAGIVPQRIVGIDARSLPASQGTTGFVPQPPLRYPQLGWIVTIKTAERAAVVKRYLVAIEDPGVALNAVKAIVGKAMLAALDRPVNARELVHRKLNEGDVHDMKMDA